MKTNVYYHARIKVNGIMYYFDVIETNDCFLIRDFESDTWYRTDELNYNIQELVIRYLEKTYDCDLNDILDFGCRFIKEIEVL